MAAELVPLLEIPIRIVVDMKEKDEEDCCVAISFCNQSALISYLNWTTVELLGSACSGLVML